MDLTAIITGVISFLSGGALLGIIQSLISWKNANRDDQIKGQDYVNKQIHDFIEELKEIIDKSKVEIAETRTSLHNELKAASQELIELKIKHAKLETELTLYKLRDAHGNN